MKMGEIDTNPIEPVQVAISLFGEKCDLSKQRSTSSDLEKEKEKYFEGVLKDLANYKLQFEAKDSAYKQVLLNLEYNRKITEELSTLLNQSEAEREKYMEDYTRATAHMEELGLKLEEMADQLSETSKICEQLLHVLDELKAAQDKLFSVQMEMELASARGLQFKAMAQAQLMESAAGMDNDKAEELLRHVSELKEDLRLTTIGAEKVKCIILSEKDVEIEDLKKQLEIIEELENQLLKQSNELLSSSKKATSNAENDVKKLKADIQIKEIENSDQAFRIEGLVMELSQLKLELKNANEEIDLLKSNIEMLTDELGKANFERDTVKKRETEAQAEIALLKSELRKGRSRIAAVPELAVEAGNARMESQKLKQGEDKIVEESEFDLINPQVDNSFQDVKLPQADDQSETEAERRRDEYDARITISFKEYESLIKKANKADQILVSSVKDSYKSEYECELQTMAKVGEFRTRAEQAIARAEAAEKAKTTLEERLRRWQERKEWRNTAIAALREESAPEEYSNPTYEKRPATYQPLGKVLNMKF
ncbi:hypothetical protein ACOSP7_023749 [Xanthoceras sorbifolium]